MSTNYFQLTNDDEQNAKNEAAIQAAVDELEAMDDELTKSLCAAKDETDEVDDAVVDEIVEQVIREQTMQEDDMTEEEREPYYTTSRFQSLWDHMDYINGLCKQFTAAYKVCRMQRSAEHTPKLLNIMLDDLHVLCGPAYSELQVKHAMSMIDYIESDAKGVKIPGPIVFNRPSHFAKAKKLNDDEKKESVSRARFRTLAAARITQDMFKRGELREFQPLDKEYDLVDVFEVVKLPNGEEVDVPVPTGK